MLHNFLFTCTYFLITYIVVINTCSVIALFLIEGFMFEA